MKSTSKHQIKTLFEFEKNLLLITCIKENIGKKINKT